MKLLLIYNARSGKINAVLSSLHKILVPNTYPCHLCVLTHDFYGEKRIWKKFTRNNNIELECLHLDELNHLKLDNYEFPVIYKINNGKLVEFMSSEEINNIKTIQDLINRIKLKCL